MSAPDIEELWKQAQALYDQGASNWPEAAEVYSRILELDPQHVPALVQRGLVVYEMGEPEKALPDFELALLIDPNYALAYYGRGWVKHSLGDYLGELQDAMRGLELDPQNGGRYYRRIGAAYSGLKEYHEAIAAYNHALKLNANRRDEGTLFNRGMCYWQLKEYPQALADFSRCLELDPDWAWAFEARGRVHYYMGNYDLAIADCHEALKNQSSHMVSYLTRGLSYKEKGDYPKAQADFQELLKSPGWRKTAERELADLPAPKRWWWPFA